MINNTTQTAIQNHITDSNDGQHHPDSNTKPHHWQQWKTTTQKAMINYNSETNTVAKFQRTIKPVQWYKLSKEYSSFIITNCG
jgi:hypothetical protein